MTKKNKEDIIYLGDMYGENVYGSRLLLEYISLSEERQKEIVALRSENTLLKWDVERLRSERTWLQKIFDKLFSDD